MDCPNPLTFRLYSRDWKIFAFLKKESHIILCKTNPTSKYHWNGKHDFIFCVQNNRKIRLPENFSISIKLFHYLFISNNKKHIFILETKQRMEKILEKLNWELVPKYEENSFVVRDLRFEIGKCKIESLPEISTEF